MASSRGQNWLILGVYAVLTAVITWPTLAHLGTHIPGSEGDALNHLWTFHWVRDAWLSGQSPFYTHQLYYPQGVSLLFHNIAWVHIVVWLPLQAIIGAAAAYSLIFIANFAANAFAFYLFAREESGSHKAAFVGGLVCGFWPYNLSHHNHPNLILIAWLLLAMLYLRRTIHHGRKSDALWTAVFIALIGLTRWQLLVMSLLPLGAYLLYQLYQQRPSRLIFSRLALTGFIAALLMAPLAVPVLQAQFGRNNPNDLFVAESPNQTDLLAYFVPNRYHPLWGEAALPLYENFGINKSFTPTLGYTTLLLVALALLRRGRQAWFWLLLALLMMALALGPTLRVNGTFYGPLAYRWLQDSFLAAIIRHPDRFNVLLALPIAMLVTWGITAVSSRLLYGLAALLIVFESLTIYPQYPLTVPAWYEQVAQEPGTFAILDLPIDDRSYDKEYMLYQLTHGKPLVGGHVSRLPAEALTFIHSVPFLQQSQGRNRPPALANVSHQMNLLDEAGVRYVVLHKKFLSREQELAWQTWFIRPPTFVDDSLILYETAAYAQPPPITQPLATNEQGVVWGIVQSAVFPTDVAQAGEIQLNIGWGSLQPPQSDSELCFELQSDTGITPLTPCQPLTAEWPLTQWQANEWVATSYTFALTPYLPAGDYTVRVASNEATAVIGTFHLEAQSRQFNPPTPQTATDFLWPDAFKLVGYDTAVQGETVTLALHWQAQQRLDRSYKFFVHLLSRDNGTVVAQADAIPRDWTYPTDWWETAEFVSDQITLTAPPGSYDVFVGWYDPDTGERLPVQTAVGESLPDQAVPLTTLTISAP